MIRPLRIRRWQPPLSIFTLFYFFSTFLAMCLSCSVLDNYPGYPSCVDSQYSPFTEWDNDAFVQLMDIKLDGLVLEASFSPAQSDITLEERLHTPGTFLSEDFAVADGDRNDSFDSGNAWSEAIDIADDSFEFSDYILFHDDGETVDQPVHDDLTRKSAATTDGIPGENKIRTIRIQGKLFAVCPWCSAKFSRTRDCRRHVQSKHQENKHSCDKCARTFSRRDIMLRHARSKRGCQRRS
ncbi:hypothetical protein BJV82DRAFT_636173 [Fennellomyces sp. T-0311]|nr:hypothetical protein BJV82DRAFT_636173 [Fennellomyces sp. T-0311]